VASVFSLFPPTEITEKKIFATQGPRNQCYQEIFIYNA
jgi:hypothetical protein